MPRSYAPAPRYNAFGPGPMYRNVRTPDLVLLWARAAGMCSHPDCRIPLVLEGHDDDPAVTLGQAAHIVARSDAGPRGGIPVAAWRRNAYDNLILLCGHHHALIDRAARRFSVDDLRAWKAEHEAWVKHVTLHRDPPFPWTAIVQDPDRRIDIPDAVDALGPGNTAAQIVELPGDPAAVDRVLAETPPDRRRFAVFSLASIPRAIQLGYLLGDRARVALYHYDRDRASWRWQPSDSPLASDLAVTVARAPKRSADAVLRVSLSARIGDLPVPAGVHIEIAAAAPSVRWLRREEQLAALARAYEAALAEVRARGARRLHLFFAGPGAAAVAFGRAYNPRMNPELVLYDYRRGVYSESLRLA